MARLLRDDADRLRLPWRLTLWLALAAGGTAALSPLLPGGASGSAGPVLVAGLLAGWVMLASEGRSPAALGFHARRSGVAEAGLGLALGVVVALAAVALVAAAGGVRWSAQAGSAQGWLVAGASALWLFALPAAAEEVVFRGYPFQALAESWGAWPALAVTSVGFGLVHLANPEASWSGAATVAAAGVFLGLVLLRTGSLWWATGVHLGWNWAHGFLVDLPVSGLDPVDAPLVEARTSGPAWLSGGAFGPEGSLLATAALAAAALWVWRTGRLGPSPAFRGDDPAALPLMILEGPRGSAGPRSGRGGRRRGEGGLGGNE
jgi:membrane protease YdiL (CAAX protease family)